VRIILVIALIAVPAVARADDPPPRTFEDALGAAVVENPDPYGVSFTGSTSCDCQYYPDEVPKPSPWDTVGALGFVIEKRDIGGTRTDHLGVLLGAGLSHGTYQLGAELHVGFDRTDVEPVASGFAGQASVHLRRDLIQRSGSEDDFGAGFNAWLDAGAGAELVWFGGDQVVRPVATLGVGLGGRAFKTSKPGRWAGLSLEFRVVATPSIEWRDLAAERCTSGDCDMRLAKPDFSGLLVIGVPFSS
jgi:hypothetical protein